MQIKKIDYILAIAEEGSISRAAERLMVAQPSLSRYLSSFERENHVQLFERKKRNRLVLTQQGKLYVAYARHVRAQTDIVFRKMAAAAQAQENEIRIAFTTNNASMHTDAFEAQLRLLYPNAWLHVHSIHVAFIEQSLMQGTVDLVITKNYTWLFDNDDLVFEPFPKAVTSVLIALPAHDPHCALAEPAATDAYPVLDPDLLSDMKEIRLIHMPHKQEQYPPPQSARHMDVTTAADVIRFVEKGDGFAYIASSYTELIARPEAVRLFVPKKGFETLINGCTHLKSHRLSGCEKALCRIMEDFPCW